MSQNLSTRWVKRNHLTKNERLPQCIKDAEKIIKSVRSCRSNFKTALANTRHRGNHFKKVYSLSLNVLKHYEYIQKILDHLQILEKEKMLQRETASILVYEILFGKGYLSGESKPVLTVENYKNDIIEVHQEFQASGREDFKIKALNLPRYARVHTLITTVPYVIKDLESSGFQQNSYSKDISEDEYIELIRNLDRKCFVIDRHFKDLLVFAYNENLTNLELYHKGHIFLQDKSSCIPVHALDPEPGSAVLDACAAPGMKSVHIAAKLQNKGLLIACERDASRFKTLKEMLDYGSVKISKIFCKDFKLVDPNDQAFSTVDYILLDPSCSGSGMVNRMDEVTDTKDSKTKERLQKLAGFQIILLKHALKFPSVKRVVYSTCSIHEEENEYVVQEALNAFSDKFTLIPVFPEWSVRGLDTYECGKFCLRTVPDKHLTNGFFVAAFKRLDEKEVGHSNMLFSYEETKEHMNFRNDESSSKRRKKSKYISECSNHNLNDSNIDDMNLDYGESCVSNENGIQSTDVVAKPLVRKKKKCVEDKGRSVDVSMVNIEIKGKCEMESIDLDRDLTTTKRDNQKNPKKNSNTVMAGNDPDGENNKIYENSFKDENPILEPFSGTKVSKKWKHNSNSEIFLSEEINPTYKQNVETTEKNNKKHKQDHDTPTVLYSDIKESSQKCGQPDSEIFLKESNFAPLQDIGPSRKKNKKKHKHCESSIILCNEIKESSQKHGQSESEILLREEINSASIQEGIETGRKKHKKKHKQDCLSSEILSYRMEDSSQKYEQSNCEILQIKNINPAYVQQSIETSAKKQKKKHKQNCDHSDVLSCGINNSLQENIHEEKNKKCGSNNCSVSVLGNFTKSKDSSCIFLETDTVQELKKHKKKKHKKNDK